MDIAKLQELMKQKKAALKTTEKTIKPAPGANRYVILPGWRPAAPEVIYHEWGQHYIKDAAGQIQAVYPCEEATYGKPCAVCQTLNAAIRSTADDETVELLKGARAAQSFLFNVLALDSADPNTPQILEVRKSVFTQILDTAEEWGPQMFDPANPQIIVINREGKGLNTKYSVQISPKRHAVPKSALERVHNLDEYVRQENEEKQNRALSAISNVAGMLPAPGKGFRPSASSTEEAVFGSEPATSANNAARNAAQVDTSLDLGQELDELFAGSELTV